MIRDVLNTVNELTKRGVTYPPELLTAHDVRVPLAKECLGYLVEGIKIKAGYFHWLTFLARHSDAKLILELGNRYGSSTIALFHGLKQDQSLISMDIVKDQRFLPKTVVADKRVKLVYGDCLDLSAYCRHDLSIPVDIDILWSDTVHYYDQISAEFQVYEPLLADEAIVAIDDIRLNDKGKFFTEAPYEKYDLTDVCHGSGFGVIHYVRPLDQRGRSRQERINIALERSTEIITARYWALLNEYEAYKARSLHLRARKTLGTLYRALRKAVKR